MFKSKLMLPILAVIVGVAASAFTTVNANHSNTRAGTYWYTYTGPTQSVSDRSNPANYTNPSTSEPQCVGKSNECAVEVRNVSGTPPADISSLSITFDGTTGMPDGGSNFGLNAQKN